MALGLIPNSFSFTINLGLFISLNQKRQKYLRRGSSSSKLLTFGGQIIMYWGFPDGASGKKIHLQMQETQEMWVQSLSQEDPLE